jgi:aminoethylphosphonate catabolism LysR family transcriptional regulator
MNETQLRCFHAAATEGSITKAAVRLGVSQPAVSVHIATLEKSYGVQLFRRVGRTIALTEFGLELKAITERLFAVQAEARDLLLSQRNLRNGHLRIGTSAPQRALLVVQELQTKHPDVTFSMQTGNSMAIREALTRYDIDIGISSDFPAGDRKTHVQLLLRDELVLLVHRDHRLAQRDTVSSFELADETIILREHGSMTRSTFLREMNRTDIAEQRQVTVGSREAVKEAAGRGLGVAPEVRSTVITDDRYVVVPFAPPAPTLDIYVACPRDQVRKPLIRALLDTASIVADHLENGSDNRRWA